MFMYKDKYIHAHILIDIDLVNRYDSSGFSGGWQLIDKSVTDDISRASQYQVAMC